MARMALVVSVVAAGLAGCAALSGESRPPEWQTRADEMTRVQARLEMRVDEVTRNLLSLRERLESQEAAIRQFKEDRETRDEPIVPSLQVVKVEPIVSEAVPAGAMPNVQDGKPDREAPAREGVHPQTKGEIGEAKPADLYRRAYSGFRDGRFGQAILDFEDFLRRYPEHEYADNAQYWIGECYYSQREFGEAIVEFGRVLEKYPKGGKAPDALLKIGLAYQQLGELEKARVFWKRLVSEYPSSEGSMQAKKLLAGLQ